MSSFISIVRKTRQRATNNKFKQFIDDEIREIEKYKWIRSEEVHYDLGETAVLEWIAKYAKDFREFWEREHGNCCSGYTG